MMKMELIIGKANTININKMESQELIQKIIKFAEDKWEDSSHTYLSEYRASRQSSKEFRDFVKKLADEEGLDIKTKDLSCRYD